MSWRVFSGIFLFWLGCALLTGFMTNIFIDSSGADLISVMLRPQTPAYTNPVGGISTTISTGAGWVLAFFNMMFFDFVLFSGDYMIVRAVILCIIAGVFAVNIFSGIKPA